jgi:hypothetical protein
MEGLQIRTDLTPRALTNQTRAKDYGKSDENGGMDTTAGDATEPSGLSPIFGSKGVLARELKSGGLNLAKKASFEVDKPAKANSDRLSAEGAASKPSTSPIARDLVIKPLPTDLTLMENISLSSLSTLFA